jgi:glucose-1-phosphate thymidylyltransferase
MKKRNIVGIIPAAGRGSRLAPFPCPKELFPVGYQDYELNGNQVKRPKVVGQYLVENMIVAGVTHIYFIVSEGKGDIMNYFGNGSRFGIHISYLFQDELQGMPGAINLAEPWIGDATVVFGMPDTIIEPNDALKQLLDDHTNSQATLSLGLFHTDSPQKFGMVETDDHGNVTFTIDKPNGSNLDKMWGCCCWSSEFTALIKEYLTSNLYESKEIVLGDVFNLALKRKLPVRGLEFSDGHYIDIGTTDELDLAIKKFHL